METAMGGKLWMRANVRWMIRSIVLYTMLMLAVPWAASQDGTSSRYAFTVAPAERFEVGATLVERHGSGKRALVMIPGLASGPWAWQHAVRAFMHEHSVYVLTFPGFDGRPLAPGVNLETARASIVNLIEQRKLARPVLVGHSLGGTLALSIAAERPELVGGVVSLDGVPVFPGTEGIPEAQRAVMAAGFRQRVAAATPGSFLLQQQEYMSGTGVVDMARADELAKLSARSDPRAVVQYMAEAFALDLRARLPKITAPVLLISPYFALDAQQQMLTEAGKTEYYQKIMEGTPKLKVVSVAPARHFAMFDAPEKVNEAIADFLKSL
jgi:pimeloyl-ACP methyl ester carboxylesterase